MKNLEGKRSILRCVITEEKNKKFEEEVGKRTEEEVLKVIN